MKIFISFSSKDSLILKPFVDRVLKLGLQINAEDINCVGIESSKPRTGEDFKNWIKNNIQNATIIIQLISMNYKESEVCLNELGASWLSSAKKFPLLIQPLDYNNVGFIHNTNQLLKIDSRSDLFKFADDLMEILEIKKIKTELLNSQIDNFLDEVEEDKIFIQNPVIQKEEIGKTKDFNYFKKLIQINTDSKSLIVNAQPNLSDCRQVFTENYSELMYDYYSKLFKGFNKGIDLSKYETFEMDSASYYELLSNEHSLPGGMSSLAKNGIIKTNVRFYTVRYKRLNEEFGTSFTAWTYINKRWIFFPKPWRFIKSLISN